ncbi:response regulator transcription factor [Flavihumibacter sp. R14]|nr:response regulator transcription factor [Flavihumibacter soli]
MKKSRILVIEDENLMNRTIEFQLKKDGHEVDTALDGKTGVAKIEANYYDLIILDIMLPYLNGLEILAKIKQNPERRDIPVIIISATGLEDTVLEGFKLGANDFITKPFILPEFSIRVKRLLMLK